MQVNMFINNLRKIHGSLSLAINQAMAWTESLSQEFPVLPAEYIPCSYVLWAAPLSEMFWLQQLLGGRQEVLINKSEDTQIIRGREGACLSSVCVYIIVDFKICFLYFM